MIYQSLKNKGFTLLELLVVIAIIGILTTIIIASLGSSRDKAKDSKAISQLSSMRTQAELYRSTYGNYGPNTTNCDDPGTLFGPGQPESLNALIQDLGYYSGAVGCYVDPDKWGVVVRTSDNNLWCTDSTYNQVVSANDIPSLDPGSWCYAMLTI